MRNPMYCNCYVLGCGAEKYSACVGLRHSTLSVGDQVFISHMNRQS